MNFFIFPIAGGTAKMFGRYHGVRESTPRREQLVRSEDLREELQGNSERSQPAMTFGQWKETLFIVITSNLEFSQVYVPKETFPSRLIYIDVTRATNTHLDVLQGSRIYDYWNVDVDRHLSDSWTGFTKFTLNENFSKDACGPEGGLQRFKKLPDLNICGLKFGPACQKKEKQEWAIEKPKLDDARNLRGI